jgi:hypothetical protein
MWVFCAMWASKNWPTFQRCLLSQSSVRFTLMEGAVSTSETSVNFYQPTRHNYEEVIFILVEVRTWNLATKEHCFFHQDAALSTSELEYGMKEGVEHSCLVVGITSGNLVSCLQGGNGIPLFLRSISHWHSNLVVICNVTYSRLDSPPTTIIWGRNSQGFRRHGGDHKTEFPYLFQWMLSSVVT